jgi:Mlc titration factor MtfA (ptsG expression regulator)
LPLAQSLPHPKRVKLRKLATLFLLDKSFSAAHGMAINDTMRACVAAIACLPVLDLELAIGYYDDFKGIVLYPEDFLVREQRTDEAGVVHDEIKDLCGQAMSHGPMILSWQTIISERISEGKDVVIHECAHKIDMLNGAADGLPPLHADMSVSAWARAFQTAYDTFVNNVDAGHQVRLDPYAAEDAAEFFAVMSETFFTRPDIVYEDFPDVYKQLSTFYRQDTYSR